VNYSVKPEGNLPTGTQISNQAFVKFDLGPWKPAPPNPDSEIPGYGPWVNTIDSGAPMSHVMALPETVPSETFTVEWEGMDDAGGSGVRDYTIYVSEGADVFTEWISHTNQIWAEFTGEQGHSYSFYSVAEDNVGNAEEAPLVADTITVIEIPVTPSLENVTSASRIDKFSTRYDRRTGQFSMMATWTNIGAEAFSEPRITIENITSSAVTVANADGETEDSKPYFDYSELVSDGKLDPGETSEAKKIVFNNPSRARFEFDITCWAKVESGGGETAPSKQQSQRIHIIIPGESSLAQNYPNPFNPETWIPYELADSGDVRIHIYNIQGRLVRTLELGHQEIGQYYSRDEAAYWDGRNHVGEKVASGIYFYQIQAGEFQSVKKMIMVK
jgi:hypothetical protein